MGRSAAGGDGGDGAEDPVARANARRGASGGPGSNDLDPRPGSPRVVGFPVVVKASSGGGGKGMRVVRSAADLSDAIASLPARGRGGVRGRDALLERYLERPRHVEVQVFGDGTGGRRGRRARVLAPAAPPEGDRGEPVARRARPGSGHASRRRRSPRRGRSGTEAPGRWSSSSRRTAQFYFLEMNTRLQVEHPVTEEAYGDRPRRPPASVAAGEPLPADLPRPRQATRSRRGSTPRTRRRVPSADRARSSSARAGGPRRPGRLGICGGDGGLGPLRSDAGQSDRPRLEPRAGQAAPRRCPLRDGRPRGPDQHLVPAPRPRDPGLPGREDRHADSWKHAVRASSAEPETPSSGRPRGSSPRVRRLIGDRRPFPVSRTRSPRADSGWRR